MGYEVFVNAIAMVGSGMIGYLIGNLLVMRVMTWIALVHEIWTAPYFAGRNTKPLRVVVGTLLHSGPWCVVIAIVLAFNVRFELWVASAFVGVAIGILLPTITAISIARRGRRSRTGK